MCVYCRNPRSIVSVAIRTKFRETDTPKLSFTSVSFLMLLVSTLFVGDFASIAGIFGVSSVIFKSFIFVDFTHSNLLGLKVSDPILLIFRSEGKILSRLSTFLLLSDLEVQVYLRMSVSTVHRHDHLSRKQRKVAKIIEHSVYPS